ncbi:7795_t:CDS:2 [Diversispora eburnea]|uniref:Pre-mRNA-splicing factor 38 n=1 Tax=Diversispora eburnea TaxID=1213867 RepID=A0A9N8V1K5_9GLOM|nr:7795_t:CDS:2 [Diversispora eburnea]
MANRTVSDAIAVHGTNPQYLIEKIIRTRIYECLYWKESCFGLTAETLVDRAAVLSSFGGQYGNQKPTEFLCLTLKLLQLQPSKEIIIEFIRNEDFKYLRALSAFYLRLVGTSIEIYQNLEPLLNDYRKLRKQSLDGEFSIVCMDEFINELLREDRACDIILPRITKRHVLEENGELKPRESVLQELLDEDDGSISSSSQEVQDVQENENVQDVQENEQSKDLDINKERDKRIEMIYLVIDIPSNRRRQRTRSKGRSRSRSRNRGYDRYEPIYRRRYSSRERYKASSYRPSRHRKRSRSKSE